MEYLDIYMLADARNVQIVDENLEAISGLVTLIKDVPVTINLHMYDVYGEPYTEDALNNHIWSFIVAHDYNTTTTPQLRANAISVAGNVLKIEISNMNTVELNEQLKDEKSIRLGAELYGKSIEDAKDNWVMQFNVSIRNRRESNGIPTGVENNYYTKGEVDAKISGITLDVPVKVSELENDAGYITIEQIPEIDLSEYALKTDIPDVSSFITADALTGYALKSEIPVVDVDKAYVDAELAKKANSSEIPIVPAVVSAFTNDAGYITIDDVPVVDLINYALKSEIPDVAEKLDRSGKNQMSVDDGVFTINATMSFDINAPFSSFAGGKVVCYDGLGVMNDITLNSNSSNTAGGLVVVGSNGKIPENLYDKTEVDLTPYALKTELPVVDVNKAYVDAELAKKLNSADAFSGSYNDLTDVPEIPVVPDNITTQGNVFNGTNQLVKTDDTGKIPAELYDAGSGGSTYTAGSGINIADDVISVGLDGYQASSIDMYIQSDYAHFAMYNREFRLGKKNGNGRIYSANNCEDINIIAGTLFLSRDVKAGNMYLNTKNYSKGTVETSCNVSYTDGNFCTLKLTAETACTLTVSGIPAYATLMVIVDNANAGSILFGSEEVISTAETGKYALVFSNFGSSIKLYNKIEV